MKEKAVKNWKIFKSGMRDGVPIALGYFAVSFSLGIQAKQIGVSAIAATVMSLTNLTSAGEAAALTLIAAHAPYLEMAISQLVINIRYMLMSCALSQKWDPEMPFYHRFLVAFGVTDEIFGISIGVPGKLNPLYSYGAMALAIPGWTIGTCLGVVMGNILPELIVNALSIALYGMFVAIFVPPAKEDKHVALAVVAAMIGSLACTVMPYVREMSAGSRIIVLTIVISLVAAILFPIDVPEAGKPQTVEN
ncbi:MAG: AzlC family ABC transporter permease [Lachnospiraceae bacterium]|nr:AzlC family ABC transporter permease [Lachnospiraceae bacterium]